MAKVKTFKTIFPAVSVPLNDDYSINEPEFRAYLRWIKSFYGKGIEGLVCNGHTGEITGLTRAERKRVVEICSEECGDVMTIISESFLVSADLGIRAIIFAVIIGILLGAVAAIKRGSAWDSVSMFIAMIGVSVPSFILGAVLQYFLGLQLRKTFGINLFPIQGWGKFNQTLLPSFALGLGSLATVSRLMRTSMLDVLGQDYIKTAKSKGLSQGKILWRHALRNAIMPVVTVMGPTVASVLTGTFVIESIFNIPGLGKYFVTSIKDLDYTMIGGTVVFYGGLLIVCTLVVDLLYGFIDPRVKLEG